MDSQKLLTKRNIIGLIGALILLISLPLGIFLSQQTQIFKPRATDAQAAKPENVRVSCNPLGQVIVEWHSPARGVAFAIRGSTNNGDDRGGNPANVGVSCTSANCSTTDAPDYRYISPEKEVADGQALSVTVTGYFQGQFGVSNNTSTPATATCSFAQKPNPPTISNASCDNGTLNLSWTGGGPKYHIRAAKDMTKAQVDSSWASGGHPITNVDVAQNNHEGNTYSLNVGGANNQFYTVWIHSTDGNGNNSDPVYWPNPVACAPNVNLEAADCQLTPSGSTPITMKVEESKPFNATFTAKNSSGNAVAGGPYGNIQVYKSDGTFVADLANWSQRSSLDTSFIPTAIGLYKVVCRAGNGQAAECHGGGLGITGSQIACPNSASVATVNVLPANTADCRITSTVPISMKVGESLSVTATYSSNNLNTTYGEIDVYNSSNQNLSVTDPFRSWVSGPGKYSMDSDAPGNNPTTGNSITFAPLAAGNYRIACRATNGVQTECRAPGITGGTIACTDTQTSRSIKLIRVDNAAGSPLGVTCTATPASVTSGTTVTWRAQITPSDSGTTVTWSGAGVTPTTGSTVTSTPTTDATSKTDTANVTATANGQTATATCSVTVTKAPTSTPSPSPSAPPVVAPTITSCTPSKPMVGVGESFTYSMVVNSGSFAGNLSYGWESIDGLPVFEQTSANNLASITGSFTSAGNGTSKLKAIVYYSNQSVKLDCTPVGIKVVSLGFDTEGVSYATEGLDVTLPIRINTALTGTVYNVSAVKYTLKYNKDNFDFVSLDVHPNSGLTTRCPAGGAVTGRSFCKISSNRTNGTVDLESGISGEAFVVADPIIATLKLKGKKVAAASDIVFQDVVITGATPGVILGVETRNLPLEVKARIFTKTYQICEANGEIEWDPANTNIRCSDSVDYKYFRNTGKVLANNGEGYRFRDQNPGLKTIFVKFKSVNNQERVEKVLIDYKPNPSITGKDSGITCNFVGEGMEAIIYGTNFYQRGAGSGVKINGQQAEITNWTDQNVTPPGSLPAQPVVGIGSSASAGVGLTASSSFVSPSPTATPSSNSEIALKLWMVKAKITKSSKEAVPVELTTTNGAKVSGTCQVGVTSLDFTVQSKCGPLPTAIKDEVEVAVYENIAEATALIKSKFRVDSKGKPQSFVSPSLQRDRDYSIIVKAPKTLAKKAEFKTKNGTTIVDKLDLPVGNIFPAANPDSIINSLDYSELKRQWNSTTTGISGDFNEDGKVNSIDWSCMRENFNKEDESFTGPTTATR